MVSYLGTGLVIGLMLMYLYSAVYMFLGMLSIGNEVEQPRSTAILCGMFWPITLIIIMVTAD